MDTSTERLLDQWWASLLGIDLSRLWHEVTVTPHAGLGDYPAWFVARRADGLHVSTPSRAAVEDVASLTRQPVAALRAVELWAAFARQRGLRMVGPSTHAYLDRDPGAGEGVVEASPPDLAALRERVTEDEWAESGFGEGVSLAWVLREDGRPVAAANLTEFAGVPRDVGVLVDPAARGRGLAEHVGRHAASYAVRTHGRARWRARTTNVASARTAERLGFEPWCLQLALTPGS